MWNIQSSNKLPIALVIAGIIVLGAISINTFYKLTQPSQSSVTSEEETDVVVRSDTPRKRIEPQRNLSSASISDEPVTDYELPDTLTGKTSISMMKNMLLTMSNPNLAGNEDMLANVTAERVLSEMNTTAITLEEVVVENRTARSYANEAANIILENDLVGMEHEITILNKALRSDDPTPHYQDLADLATMYQTITDELKQLGVPAELSEEHVYLVNAFNAMAGSLQDISQTESDPMRAYVRLNRYTEDVKYLEFAMQNLAFALIRTQESFQANDPALMFSTLLPDINS